MKVRIELNFPSALKEEPIICSLCKKFNIILSIVEASFSTEVGWAILIFAGEEEEVAKATGYLRNKGVRIEKIEKIP